MSNPPAPTPTEELQDQDSVITRPIRSDGGVNSSGLNTVFNAPEFADFPQHDIQIQRNGLSIPSDFMNEDDRLFFDLNGSTDSMANPSSIAAKNGMSEFNKESDVPYAAYPIRSHGSEDKNGKILTLPMPLRGNFGVSGNTNNGPGNILNLGIGGGAEVKVNSNFSTREIASKLENPVSISSSHERSMVRQGPTNPLNLAPFTGLAMVSQTNGDGLSSPALVGSSMHQANPQSSFSMSYDDFLVGQAPSRPSSGIPMITQPRYVTQSSLVPQMPRPTSHTSQFVQLQQRYTRRSPVTASSATLREFLTNRQGGSSISHAQLGTLNPLTEAMITHSTGVRTPGSDVPMVHSATSHNLTSVAALGNSSIPIPSANTLQSAVPGGSFTPFPRRLGVHPNHPTARGTPALRLPAQAYQVRPLLPIRLPTQAYQVRPLLRPVGHHHHPGMLAQVPMEFPRPVNPSGAHLPIHAQPISIRPLVPSGPVGRPEGPLAHQKRRATESPSTSVSQRRKISPSPQPNDIPHYPAPIPLSHIPPPQVHHIKCQGVDEPPKPSGHKCFLCKRDLFFTSEGRVSQPTIPPVAAVLPCGHTFHDDCLQKMTPEEFSKEPPCIPCALGEM